MKILNPNYVNTSPASITPGRWTAIQAALTAYFVAHPEVAAVDVGVLQTLVPELQTPDVFEQLRRVMVLTVVP